MENLTNAEASLIAELATQGPVAVVEYRGEKPEIVEYIDKSNGKKRFIVKHTLALEVLGTGEQMPAELYGERRAKPDPKEDEVRPELPPHTGLKKGERLVANIGGYFFKEGTLNCKLKAYMRLDNLGAPAKSGESGVKEYHLNSPVKPLPVPAKP